MTSLAPEKLFSSTAQALDFWLEVAQKREAMPAKAYLEFLNSFGWNRRSTLAYVKLADFIQEHLLGHIDAIAKLDIRTLLKFPLPRYAPIVEAVKAAPMTQKEVTELIKQLPKKPRTGFVPTGEGGARMFALPPLHNESGKVVERAAQLTGLSLQKLVEEACHLVTSIITGEDLPEAIARIQELAIKQQPDDLEPQAEQRTDLPYGLALADPVQWQQDGKIMASHLTQVEYDTALLEVGEEVYSVPLADLRKIDINAIASEISDHKKLTHPYSQLYINAVNAKQEWKTLQALPDGDETYDWQFRQFSRFMRCAEAVAKSNDIWFDWDELAQNQRLVVVPGGNDLIAALANTAKPKHKAVTKTSFLEAFSSGELEKPTLEQCLKDADNWYEIALLVQRNNKTLNQAMETWTIEEIQILIGKLATFLESSFNHAIQEDEIAWLHHTTLSKGLARLELEVNKEVCKFTKFIDYGTPHEMWCLRSEQNKTVVVPRQEVKIFRF